VSAPAITIFVRHSAGCKYEAEEFYKRCNCKKFLRWFDGKKLQRMKTGARSWAEAEDKQRELADQLSGRVTATPGATAKAITDAVSVFIEDKRVQGITNGVLSGYTLELGRLADYCATRGVYTVQGITREILTGFCSTWPAFYASTTTRIKVRQRCRSFLLYCYETKWLERAPQLPKIKVDEPETQPLTGEEYARLLAAVNVVDGKRWDGKGGKGTTPKTRDRLRALVQLMRWSGLAIRDAVTLPREAIKKDADGYHIVTARQKTGTHVSVPLPPAVAEEVLALDNSNPKYLFWTGKGQGQTIANVWTVRYIRPLFDAAGIVCGHMVSHRLRDTFAVDLLEKGVPMEEVSRMLGHTSIKTTEKSYAKWSRGRQERANALVRGTWVTPKPEAVPKRQRAA
jgi:site-specific recombinase XerD